MKKYTLEKLKELNEKRTKGDWVMQKTEGANLFEVAIVKKRTEHPICYNEIYIPQKVKIQDMEVIASAPVVIEQQIEILTKLKEYKENLINKLDIFNAQDLEDFNNIFEDFL